MNKGAFPRFYIVKANPCDKCHGTGEVDHPKLPILKQWKRGLDDFASAHHVQPSVVEQPMKCPNCNGSGEIRNEVTLVEALAALGVESHDALAV